MSPRPWKQYQDVLSFLENTLANLELACADPAFLERYRNVLAYLRSQREEDLDSAVARNSFNGRWLLEATEEELSSMTLEEIEQWISASKVTRQALERLARVRFASTRGELSALSSRAKLIDKFQILITNERTHGAIERAATEIKSNANYPLSASPITDTKRSPMKKF